MALVVIGPVTRDLIVIGGEKSEKIGGATYFQSFVFEEFYTDYVALVNCSDEDLVNGFPDLSKVRVIKKDDTHFFINDYPDSNNRDFRMQLSNFADIPILPSDLDGILPDEIDGFVLNPLNRYDFPPETVEYLKTFGVPIFLSVQGFLRIPNEQVNENYTIKLDNFDELQGILSNVNAIFFAGDEIRIDAVRCDDVVDTTGCGDTYMATYVSQRIKGKSKKEAGNMASLIASKKITTFGPYNFKK